MVIFLLMKVLMSGERRNKDDSNIKTMTNQFKLTIVYLMKVSFRLFLLVILLDSHFDSEDTS